MNGRMNKANRPDHKRPERDNVDFSPHRPARQPQGNQHRASSIQEMRRRPSQPPSTQTSQSTKQPKAQKRISGLQDNLRSQTPLNRRLRQQSAPTEPGTERRRSTPQHFKVKENTSRSKSAKKPRSKGTRSFAYRSIVLGLIAYAILLPIFILAFYIMLPGFTTVTEKEYVYQIGDNKNVISKKVYSVSRIRHSGIYYIEMDSIASYCDLTTTGNSERMRYVSRKTGESVEFLIGQSIAYINGVSERTGGDCYIYDGKVYVPLEFANRCFIGITVTLDTTNGKIMIVRDVDAYGKAYDLSFPYKLSDTSPLINFGELDADTQQEIIMQNQPNGPAQNGTNNTIPNN